MQRLEGAQNFRGVSGRWQLKVMESTKMNKSELIETPAAMAEVFRAAPTFMKGVAPTILKK